MLTEKGYVAFREGDIFGDSTNCIEYLNCCWNFEEFLEVFEEHRSLCNFDDQGWC